MADMVISGFVGVAIQIAINQILHHINIAIQYRNELQSLEELLLTLQDINSAMQNYRSTLTTCQVSSSTELIPLAVNNWLKKLDMLLQKASEVVEECTLPMPRYRMFSRYDMSKRITRTISTIKEHRDNAASIGITLHLLQSLRHLQPSNGDISASSSSAAPLREGMKYIGEPLIVGPHMPFARLEELLQNSPLIGVVGMGGAGKTLLLKRLFNGHQVDPLFANGICLWLTVSQIPSLTALRNELGTQIAFKTNENFGIMMSEDDTKIWLNRKLRELKFALFLDDVWGRGAILLEELGVPLPAVRTSNSDSSVIIVSSRNRSALLEMGVADSSIVQMPQLMDDDSWELFLFHAFRHNDGKIPTTINEETARAICRLCGGLPLAIKATGRAMAGITTSEGWELRLNQLQNVEPIKDGDLAGSLYGRLRLSYDALADLGISFQLCFLYLAAFVEDQVIWTPYLSEIWFGEGLLGKQDPYQQGQAYVDVLASRCLIEPVLKDKDGRVVRFRVHDVLHTLAGQIAETEENCFFRSGKGLQEFPANDCSGSVKISLRDSRLRCIPNTFRAPHIHSLILQGNRYLKEIPKQVIASMTSLKVLDLSNTSLQSLPETIGCLKHLVYLGLHNTALTRLPNSIALLKNLQILSLYKSDIKSLPSNIHNLSSLRILDVSYCKNLQCLPYGISQIKTLESLFVLNSPNAWLMLGPNKGKRRSLKINDLSALKQLKRLQLSLNGEIIGGGILGNMMQLEFLNLELPMMENLPHDMTSILKLRALRLNCPRLMEMQHPFCGFQHLCYIKLRNCEKLKQLPDFHKLVSLKQLDIVRCSNIEKLPKEYGEKGAFPRLERLSLAQLDKLKELPVLEEEAFSSLTTLSMVQCEALQIFPESYWNLKKLIKIRVYGCSTVLNTIMQEKQMLRRKEMEILRMSASETKVALARIDKIIENREHGSYGHGEFWSNQHFQYLYDIYYFNSAFYLYK